MVQDAEKQMLVPRPIIWFGRRNALSEARTQAQRLEQELNHKTLCLDSMQTATEVMACAKDSVTLKISGENDHLQHELQSLRQEIEALRKENTTLRKQDRDTADLKIKLQTEQQHTSELSAYIESLQEDMEKLKTEAQDWKVKLQAADEFHERDSRDLRRRIQILSLRAEGGTAGSDVCNTSVSSESATHSDLSFDSSLQNSPDEPVESRSDLLEKIGELHQMVRSSVRHSYSPSEAGKAPSSPSVLRVSHRCGPGLIFSPEKNVSPSQTSRESQLIASMTSMNPER
eukprot:CAMPEP_0181325184 /NCGR_PEP_ID=MMETSP1101-20121128/20783_1 /TAXON_ID=46948 /ORGANISM="Rhodomonas abbreviata, Strain Caron Lab Isolate" /LENGTH=286 /DNA_ID=CAMNT_0023433461 /DNA_START=59 /DNA_END=919 /DNA_ORIENTATION=-